MPTRWQAIGISAFWAVMMGLLVQRDVLPHWRLTPQPDFRALSQAEVLPVPVRWAILQTEHRIGFVETGWRRKPDGWCEFYSELELNPVELRGFGLLSSFLSTGAGGMLRCTSSFHITPQGNLDHFDIDVFPAESKPAMRVRGRLDRDIMRVSFRATGLSYDEDFYYEPHSLMTTSLVPIDKLPELSVGRTWEYRVMNPLARTTEVVRCEVTGEQVITWHNEPWQTYVVEQHYGRMRAHCWVKHDGTVLRQEVPFGWNTLVLEHE